MHKLIKFIILIILGTFCSVCGAADVDDKPIDSTNNVLSSQSNDLLGDESIARKLAKVKSEVVLLNAETQKAEAERKLMEARGNNTINENSVKLPTVSSIYGEINKDLSAELFFEGAILKVQKGSIISDYLKVINILENKVIIRDVQGKHDYSLFVSQKTSNSHRDVDNSTNFNQSKIPFPRWK